MIGNFFKWLKDNWFKKRGLTILIIAASCLVFGGTHLFLALYSLAIILLVIIALDWVIDRRAGWGIFPDFDLDKLLTDASSCPAGRVAIIIAMAAVLITVLFLVVPAAHASPVVDRAQPYLPILKKKIATHWPDAPMKEHFAGQIEQESRWNPQARLHTSREDGYGLAQITVTPRFNNFLSATGMSPLKSWDWRYDKFNVDYQITYLVLTNKSNYNVMKRLFRDDRSRWAGTLAAYNWGLGAVQQRHARATLLYPGRQSQWFGVIDKVRLPYERRTLYGRNLGDMRDEYPHLIINVRSQKYRPYMTGV